jgi:hypothetical protein
MKTVEVSYYVTLPNKTEVKLIQKPFVEVQLNELNGIALVCVN